MIAELCIEDLFRLEKKARMEGITIEEAAASIFHEGCLTSVVCGPVFVPFGLKNPKEAK